MSVKIDSRLTIGWRVMRAYIPDCKSREDDGWHELDGLVARAEKLLGYRVYTRDLCDVEDLRQRDVYMVGVPIFGTMRWAALVLLAELARDVYRMVMRMERADGPYLMSWEQGMSGSGSMSGNETTAEEVAKRLVSAHNLACSADVIACAIDGRNDRLLTKDECELLRDWIPDIESAIGDVLVALAGHALMEVE